MKRAEINGNSFLDGFVGNKNNSCIDMSRLSRSKKSWWKRVYYGEIVRFTNGEIVCDDALNFLNSLKEECADIIFLDPPFNLGKKYANCSEKEDRLREDDYLKYMTSILWRSIAVLKNGGSLYLYHLPKWAVRFAPILDKDMKFRHWIGISMKNGFVRGQYLHPAHYALLYYTKGEPGHFSRPRIPIAQCRKCGVSIKDYGGYKKYMRNGANLSDFWDDISPVRHKKFKHRSSNELPLKIPKRAVQISGPKNGLLVDPFAGTGTTLVAAAENRMNFVACDKEKTFLRIMEQRLAKVQRKR